jgi:hypothetical protein
MKEPPAKILKASLPLDLGVVIIQGPAQRAGRSGGIRQHCLVAGAFAAMALSAPAQADPPDISAQRLLSSWQEGDPGTKMLAEVIASAFASGFSWGGDVAGKHTYCAEPDVDVKGREIMSAFQRFLRDHPQMAGEPYGAAMAATLGWAFPCAGQ